MQGSNRPGEHDRRVAYRGGFEIGARRGEAGVREGDCPIPLPPSGCALSLGPRDTISHRIRPAVPALRLRRRRVRGAVLLRLL